jgi:hypothetical protein
MWNRGEDWTRGAPRFRDVPQRQRPSASRQPKQALPKKSGTPTTVSVSRRRPCWSRRALFAGPIGALCLAQRAERLVERRGHIIHPDGDLPASSSRSLESPRGLGRGARQGCGRGVSRLLRSLCGLNSAPRSVAPRPTVLGPPRMGRAVRDEARCGSSCVLPPLCSCSGPGRHAPSGAATEAEVFNPQNRRIA